MDRAWARPLTLALVGALALGGAFAPAGGGLAQGLAEKGSGTLVGRVTRGPQSPVEGAPGPRDAQAAQGAKLLISRPDGQPVLTVETDREGAYRAALPAGSYRVTMPSLTGVEFSKDLPATVTIVEGQETRLDLRIDTGIR